MAIIWDFATFNNILWLVNKYHVCKTVVVWSFHVLTNMKLQSLTYSNQLIVFLLDNLCLPSASVDSDCALLMEMERHFPVYKLVPAPHSLCVWWLKKHQFHDSTHYSVSDRAAPGASGNPGLKGREPRPAEKFPPLFPNHGFFSTTPTRFWGCILTGSLLELKGRSGIFSVYRPTVSAQSTIMRLCKGF